MFDPSRTKKIIMIVLALSLVFSQSGCAFLTVPVKIISTAGNLIGQSLKLLQKLPTPPPWVFF